MSVIQRINRDSNTDIIAKLATADETMYCMQRLRYSYDKEDFAFADKDFTIEAFQAVASHFGKEARFMEMTGSEINTAVGETAFYGAQTSTVFLIGMA